MQNLDHVKNGEIHLLKKGEGVNFGLISAKNMLGDMKDLANYNKHGI